MLWALAIVVICLLLFGYERLFGFETASAADATEDADGDGVANLIEFQLGTDPRDGDSAPPTVDLSAAASSKTSAWQATDAWIGSA